MFKPGLLVGGKIEHDCGTEHSIGYFLELLVAVAPFCKHPVHAVLNGITNNQTDPSVDLVKASCLPVLKKFILDDEGLEIKVSVGKICDCAFILFYAQYFSSLCPYNTLVQILVRFIDFLIL